MLLNLFQVRLRARDAPEGHTAEGDLRIEPTEVHPGDEFSVIIDLRFPEGGPPGGIAVKVSPPEDFTAEEAQVELGEEGATVTIPARVLDEVELGTYYAQVVYSDEDQEHYEDEAPLEVLRHWVRMDSLGVDPARATPGDVVDVRANMTYEGAGRVRGFVRGRLVPDGWDGDEAHVIKLPRERSSVAETREVTWHLRVPRSALEGIYHADVEFASSEESARRRFREVARLVPRRGLRAEVPQVAPAVTAPGDAVEVRTRVENTGLEALDVRVAGELSPEAGGAALALEERAMPLGPGEVVEVDWALAAPERTGEWVTRVRARAERTEGDDPEPATLDVRPPHWIRVVGAVPRRPWAAPGEEVEVAIQLTDAGARPGTEALLRVTLEGAAISSGEVEWRGRVDSGVTEGRVTVTVPARPTGAEDEVEGPEDVSTGRFSLVIRDTDGKELLSVPSAVAVRRRLVLISRVLKDSPDPLRVGDCRLSGERVLGTHDAGDLTIFELSSGGRIYTRGDEVFGVDTDAPMDEEFWNSTLDVDLRLYTDTHAGLERGAALARAEAAVMDAIAGSFDRSKTPRGPMAKMVKALEGVFDPERPEARPSGDVGPLAPLMEWLCDPGSPPSGSRGLLPDLRRVMQRGAWEDPATDAGRMAEAAATASDLLTRLAGVLLRAWEEDLFDQATLRAVVALVAAVGAAEVELHRLRSTADPWAFPEETMEAQSSSLQALSRQAGTLIEALSRHRTRRAGCVPNTRLRAIRAAVIRDLNVRVNEVSAHSGDAATLEVTLENPTPIDLTLQLNIALPSTAWAVLEPGSKGSLGLASVVPVRVPARSTATLPLILYIPTTARLESYVIPIEVVPEPRDIAPEQWGGAR